MKRTALVSIACAAALTVACNGNARTDNNVDNPGAAVGTSGDLDRGADTTAAGAPQSTASAADMQQFVQKASADGMAEVQLGQLASTHASSPMVKQFAEMMVRDHTKANDELKQVATKYNLQVATTVNDDQKDLLQKLQGLNGTDFDSAYMDAMVDAHKDAVDLVSDHTSEHVNRCQPGTQVGTSGSTPSQSEMAVTGWATMTLPTLQRHLQDAQQIQDRISK